MDDDSKTSFIIKSIVVAVVLIVIAVVAIIIVNLAGSDGNGTGGSATTRRTISGSTVEVETSEKVSNSTEETTETTETTIETTTTTVIVTQAPVTQAPVTQAPVTQAPVTQRPTQPVTQAPTTTQPVPTYSEIYSGNKTTYTNAMDSHEWKLVNKINSIRSFKVASELRTMAEIFATACCGVSNDSCEDAVEQVDYFGSLYSYQFTAYNSTGLGSRDVNGYVNWAYDKLSGKYNVGISNASWLGVGVVQSQKNSSKMCVSFVFAN